MFAKHVKFLIHQQQSCGDNSYEIAEINMKSNAKWCWHKKVYSGLSFDANDLNLTAHSVLFKEMVVVFF
jgi:hypothetical protein